MVYNLIVLLFRPAACFLFLIIALIAKLHSISLFKKSSIERNAKVVDYKLYVTEGRQTRTVYYVPIVDIDGVKSTYRHKHLLEIPAELVYDLRNQAFSAGVKEEVKRRLFKELPTELTVYFSPDNPRSFILKTLDETEKHKTYLYAALIVFILAILSYVIAFIRALI